MLTRMILQDNQCVAKKEMCIAEFLKPRDAQHESLRLTDDGNRENCYLWWMNLTAAQWTPWWDGIQLHDCHAVRDLQAHRLPLRTAFSPQVRCIIATHSPRLISDSREAAFTMLMRQSDTGIRLQEFHQD